VSGPLLSNIVFSLPSCSPLLSVPDRQTQGQPASIVTSGQWPGGIRLAPSQQHASLFSYRGLLSSRLPEFPSLTTARFQASQIQDTLDPMAQIVGDAGPSRRQADWAAFYKNGPPKEVIVIDDDTPPPPSLSSSASSSSSSTHTAPTGHLTASGTRYKITRPVMPPTTLYHPTPDSLSGPSSIPVPTRRVTRRANKRLPSTDLTHSEMPSQYAYSDDSHAARVGQHAPVNSQYRTAQSIIAIDDSPAKKKRKSNADLKHIQPVPPANRTLQYAIPQQNASTTNGNVRTRQLCHLFKLAEQWCFPWF